MTNQNNLFDLFLNFGLSYTHTIFATPGSGGAPQDKSLLLKAKQINQLKYMD